MKGWMLPPRYIVTNTSTAYGCPNALEKAEPYRVRGDQGDALCYGRALLNQGHWDGLCTTTSGDFVQYPDRQEEGGLSFPFPGREEFLITNAVSNASGCFPCIGARNRSTAILPPHFPTSILSP